MIFRVRICVLFISVSGSVVAQTSTPTSAPIVNPFQLGADNLGAISNSVNLFTGDLALPLNMVSIPGREGIGIDVSISYSSTNIENLASTWNLDAPTGILGLGWTMNTSQIIVDNQQTASCEDDFYYLVENGSSTRLINTGNSSGVKTYVTKLFSNKLITYTLANERWDVTLEDGTKLIYGDQNNGRNSVQWMVGWGNWMGSSNQPSAQKQGIVWNLAEMTSIWGDKVYYTYQTVEYRVGIGSTVNQTEASYLSMITDSFGHEVDLIYKNKLAEEYMEPHTEQPEPDTYQERYEKQYLDRILVKGDSTQGYEIDFRYAFLLGTAPSFGNITKRQLASIVKVGSTGLVLPSMTFGYQPSGPMTGALNSITTSGGGTATFEYSVTALSINHPATNLTLTAPTGYREPMVFTADDYTIVTWRQDNGSHQITKEPIKIFAYTWEGEWHETELTSTMPYTEIKKFSAAGPPDFQLITHKDFFALLMQDYDKPADPNFFHLNIWKRSEQTSGGWFFYSDSLSIDPTKKQLMAGDNFVAVSNNNGKVFRYNYTPSSFGSWVRVTDITETTGVHFTVAGPNYIISHYTGSNPDQINFYYLNEQKVWSSAISVPNAFNTGSPGNAYWYGTNTHAIVLADGQNAFAYHWDKNYSNFTRADFGFAPNSGATVYATESLVGIGPTATYTGKAFRYNGNGWIATALAQGASGSAMALTEDLMIFDTNRSTFNPNTNTWSAPVTVAQLMRNVGPSYHLGMDGLYSRKPDGTWFKLAMMLDGAYSYTGNQYFMSYNASNFGSLNYIKNGVASGLYAFPTYYHTMTSCCSDPVIYMAGLNSLVLASNYVDFYDCTTITLVRVDPRTQTVPFNDYPIDKVTTNDGIRNYYTSFKYETTTAITDVSRSVAQYNKVTTIPGSATISSSPFGYTETYFFNGVSQTELGATYPVDPSQLLLSTYGPKDNYKLLTGQSYRTKIFNATGNSIGESDTYFAVNPFAIYVGQNYVDFGFQPVVYQSISTKDLIQTTTQFKFNSLGQKSRQYDFTANSQEYVQTHFQYGWELYTNSLKARNILSPLYRVTKTLGTGTGTDVESSVTRYKEDWPCTSPTCPYTTVPAPFDQYTWKGTNTSAFTWPTVTQAPSTDWSFGGIVSARDPFNGVEIETMSKGNQVNAQIWDQLRRTPIAAISNSASSLVAYTSFEDASKGNWSWSDGTIANGASKTGNRYFNLGTIGLSKSGLNTSEKYTVSFWSNSSNGSVNISGVTGSVNLGTLSGWTLFQFTVTNVSTVTIGRNGANAVQIDEVRILPSAAQMTSTTYHPLFGPTSQTDPNHRTSNKVYDGLGRPVNVLDENGNIVNNIIYNSTK